jgi:single-strand DNA-binding protein
MSINKVILIGTLGKDPELSYTGSGSAVCKFSMATSESWNDKNGSRQERTEWHNIVVWGKLGELCNQYLAKGRKAFIEGSLHTRSWEDKQGTKKYMTEINAKNVQFLDSSKSKTEVDVFDQLKKEVKANNPAQMTIEVDKSFTTEDIPF